MAENTNPSDKSAPKKPGFFARTSRFFKDLKSEVKKVVWPNKKQVINNTGIVIAFLIVSSIIIGAFDFVINMVVGLFLK
ncbi:MAG: preprotein translocase subunit SecE [Oscillospiraceae bacterium]